MNIDIPIVDFSGMLTDSLESRRAVAEKVDRYARDVGFMYIINSGIAPETVAGMKSTSKRFFSSSIDSKLKHRFDQSLNFGYHSVASEALDPTKPKDQKETFTMRDVAARIDDRDLWPSEGFRQVSSDFYQDCRRLADRLMSAFAMALDLPDDFFTHHHTGTTQTLRLLHYPPAKALTAGQLGAGAHTDYGTLTLLFQDNSGGLEVQTKSGDWKPAPPIENAVVINTGDLLARWTNDHYRSTPHRVQVRPAEASSGRLSVAFFSDPDPDVVVESLPSCIALGERPKYPPITAEQHILEKIAATN